MKLDPERLSDEAQLFNDKLESKVKGQPRAIQRFGRIFQTWKARIGRPNRTVANLLFLGPTGVGKTHIISAAADALFGNPHAFLRINCGEFQQSHEIAKLIGSPPGYVGHKDTEPILAQSNISRYEPNGATYASPGLAGSMPLNIVAFDEIEKAHPLLWDFLLAVMDTNGGGKARLGSGVEVSFLHTILILTSNLGSDEIKKVMTGGGIGFNPSSGAAPIHDAYDQLIYNKAIAAAKKNFRSEFFNRLDRAIVFRSLPKDILEQILAVELKEVQRRLWGVGVRTYLDYTNSAREFLLTEGTSLEYGARELCRTIDRHVTDPLASLIATEQLGGERTLISKDEAGKHLTFYRPARPAHEYPKPIKP